MRRILQVLTILGVLAAGVAATAEAQPAESTAAAKPARPVIFVHGYIEGAWIWDNMIASMTAAGYDQSDFFNWQYDTTTQSNTVIAAQFGTYLNQVLAQTGATEVDIVSHSMGSLNTRWCMKFDSCAGKVHTWISLAGANHGTTVAQYCYDTWAVVTCHEMIPGSDFLATLNAAPEIPSGVTAYTLWTPNDGVIQPASSTLLDGAINIGIDPALNHLTLLDDPGIASQVMTLLEAPPPGAISGTVTGEDTGLPLSGRTVELYDGAALLDSTTTDAGGTYTFPLVMSTGALHLRFVGSAVYLPEYNGDAWTLVTAPAVPVISGGTSVVDAALTPRAWRATVTGTVTDAVSGAPVAGASVRVYLDGAFSRGVQTGADGTYTIARLDPSAGVWTLRCSGGAYQQVWWPDVVAPQAAVPLPLTGGGTTTADGRLTRLVDRPVLQGVVTAAGTGTPLAGIEVRAFQNAKSVAVTTTGAGGSYSFAQLVPGTYTVRFSDPGGSWRLTWWTDARAAAQATPVVLTAQATTTASVVLPHA